MPEIRSILLNETVAAFDVGGQVVGAAQGADVDQVIAGDQGQVAALDQAAAAHVARFGLRQIQHRHQHFLAIDDALFHPHDVVGQGRDLFGSQPYAHGQVQRGFAGEGIVHQITELLVIVVQPVGEKALAGLGQHGVADQTRFITTVAEATRGVIGAEVELAQQIIGTHERRGLGQLRVGFDQVTALESRGQTTFKSNEPYPTLKINVVCPRLSFTPSKTIAPPLSSVMLAFSLDSKPASDCPLSPISHIKQ